jgi:hypothetical protein
MWVGNPTVYMYHTPIAEFHPTGAITVRAGGYDARTTTRANIGDVVGVTLFYPRQKPGVPRDTRIYVTGMPDGVPFKDGCIVVRGSCEWHPDMPAKGITDIRNMTEEVEEVIPEVRKKYHAALRAFRKQTRPFLSFIDRATVENRSLHWGSRVGWFADLLSAARAGRGHRWRCPHPRVARWLPIVEVEEPHRWDWAGRRVAPVQQGHQGGNGSVLVGCAACDGRYPHGD